MAITKRLIKGAPITALEMDANLTELENISSSFGAVSASVSNLSTLQGTLSGQFTGSALISGSLKFTSASISFKNTTDKVIVYDSTDGSIGWSLVSGSITTSGTAGTGGTSGTGGTAGTTGTAGTSGTNAPGLTSGTAGTSGSSGTSGINGTSGTSGTNGTSGTSGSSGSSGSSGTTGSNGTTGTAGSSGTSTDSNLTNRLMQTTASLNTFTGSIRGEVSGLESYTASLKAVNIVSGAAQITALGFGAGGGSSFPYTGSAIISGSLELTGSAFIRGGVNASGIVSGAAGLSTAGPLTASLSEGYVWVGGSSNQNTRQIATSSLGGAGGGTISVIRGANNYTSVDTLEMSANFSVTNLGGGNLAIDVVGGGASGTSGSSGSSGFPGTSGSTGSAGTSGSSGQPGQGGSSGTSGTNGSNGTAGTTGSNGVSGTSGTSGVGGSNGTAGTAGTSGTATQLGVRDGGGISAVYNVNDISFSGSVILTPSGSSGVIVTITGGNANSFVSASYNGWITGSAQILDAGFVQSSSGIFKDFIVTQSMVRDWSVVNNGNVGYVFAPSNDPTLERGEDVDIWVYHGDTIIFNVVAASHPFYIKTSVTTGTGQQVTGVTNNGATGGTVRYNTSGSVPGTTIFYCSSANSNLSGPIYIKERQRRTEFKDGRIVHTGSMWVDGGMTLTGSIWLSGSIYQNGVPFSGGGGGGPFAQTASYYSANGDVFVTGSLRISGSITASAITVTSPGTPELYSATNINLNAGNAVVITSSSLRLAQFTNAQTSSLTPINGDVYYNSTTNKFMGRTSGSWIEFTSGSSVGGAGGVGSNGTSGTSAVASFSGTTNLGVITWNSSSAIGSVNNNLLFDGSTLRVTSSISVGQAITLASVNPLPTSPAAGMLAVSASLAGVSNLYFYNGTTWTQLN